MDFLSFSKGVGHFSLYLLLSFGRWLDEFRIDFEHREGYAQLWEDTCCFVESLVGRAC